MDVDVASSTTESEGVVCKNGRLWKCRTGVVPAANLHKPENKFRKRDPKHRFVQLAQLPPGVARMLEFDFSNDPKLSLPVEYDGIRLAPALAIAVSELEPDALSIFGS
jgi:hypothetical protein